MGNEVMDFEKMLEESLKEIRSGSITKGVIANVSNGNIIIDLGLKYDGIMPYSEYSDEIDANPEKELQVGEEIQFTTVPFHFYNGHKLPIVELKIDENTLLSFEDGKENLIDWVNTNFK